MKGSISFTTRVAVISLFVLAGCSFQAQSVTTITSESDFNRLVLQSSKPSLIKFSASWCGPCQTMQPTFDKVASENSANYDFYVVDIDKVPKSLLKSHGIVSIPAFIAFKNGSKANSTVGVVSKQQLEKLLPTL